MPLIALVFSGAAGAADITVCTGGSCDYEQLQPAVDDALDGDRVIVWPGAWDLAATVADGRTIELRSLAGPASTSLLEPAGGQPMLQVNNGDVMLRGFSVQQGQPQPLLQAIGATLRLRHMEFEHAGVAPESSFAVVRNNGDGFVDGCRFINQQTLGNTGALAVEANGELQVIDSDFQDNRLGVAVVGATLTLERTTMTGASGRGIRAEGGDISIIDSSLIDLAGAVESAVATVSVTGSVFEHNTRAPGGAIYAEQAGVFVQQSRFAGNSATNASNGGAIYAESPDQGVDVSGSVFDANVAAAGGAIFVSGGPFLGITTTRLSNNQSTTGRGGALRAVGNSGVELGANAWITNEAFNYGGAASLQGNTWTADNQSFYCDNGTSPGAGTDTGGGALHLHGGAQASIQDTAFVGNHTFRRGGAVWSESASSSFTNALFWGPGADDRGSFFYYVGGGLSVRNSALVVMENEEGIYSVGGPGGLDLDYNVFWLPAVGASYWGTPGPNDVQADPLLGGLVGGEDCATQDLEADVAGPLFSSPADPGIGAANRGLLFPGAFPSPLDDADGDGFIGVMECNDNDPGVHPLAREVCNGIDDDCDGAVDDLDDSLESAPEVFTDMDDDGFGDGNGPGSVGRACLERPGLVHDNTDCDDANFLVNTSGTEIADDGLDNDCDGFQLTCDSDGDGYALDDGGGACGGDDCDDGNNLVNPGGNDVPGDGIDQDCDGADAPCDVDGDGYEVAGNFCAGGDCNDSDAGINPLAAEVYDDGIDQDCDGSDAVCDQDGDGFEGTHAACGGSDCDDTAATVFPGNQDRTCDLIDDDCDGSLVDGFADLDLDLLPDCVDTDADGDGYAADDGDCDDLDANRNPGEIDIPGDAIDQDCDGEAAGSCFEDDDGDGAGAAMVVVSDGDCGAAGLASIGDDCDDNDPTVLPGAAELCDGQDNDCDAVVPGSEVDADDDGMRACEGDCDDTDATVYSGATEVLDDGIDQDCDGFDAESQVDTGLGDTGVPMDTGMPSDTGTADTAGPLDTAGDDTSAGGSGLDTDNAEPVYSSRLTSGALCGCSSGAPAGLAWLGLLPMLMLRRRTTGRPGSATARTR